MKKPERKELSDVVAGLIVVGLVVLLCAVAAYFYVNPVGKQTISFTTQDAISLQAGQDVRVAGVSVGKVKAVSLEQNDVRVSIEVNSDVPVGDQSRVDVRLLTAVGGYYVALAPGGNNPGASSTIPVSRVTVPYTIADTLQQLPRITNDVNGVPIDKLLAQMSDGLEQNSESMRNLLAGLQSISTIADKQRGQVKSILNMAESYLRTFNGSRQFLFELVRKANIVLSEYYTYRNDFTQAYLDLGQVVVRLGQVAKFYNNHDDQFYGVVEALEETTGRLRDGMTAMIANLEPVRDRIMSLVSKDGALNGPTVDVSPVCLPLPGKPC